MDKTAFVLLLILSNVVPLLAWGSMAQLYPRQKPATPRHVAARPLKKAAKINTRWKNVTVPKCDGGKNFRKCFFPLLCLCKKPVEGGYYRVTQDQYRWYYNNNTNQCERHAAAPGGCNDFDDKKECDRHCWNVTARVMSWPKRFWEAVKNQ
ncbi:uncharacterized protein LOC142768931 [Rhipicephalus microplus]|uniref:Putative serine proteinase inhibitor n=1 Tax=Rhipicephalus microplus TaxID=6941 RepID=A0A6G5A7B7_RHIMP